MGRIIDAVKIDIEGPRIGYEDKAIRNILETVKNPCKTKKKLKENTLGSLQMYSPADTRTSCFWAGEKWGVRKDAIFCNESLGRKR